MLVVLTLLTAAYLAVLVRVWRARRRPAGGLTDQALQGLASEDQPPAGAVGWPPLGEGFARYVEGGLAALDAYLSEDHTA